MIVFLTAHIIFSSLFQPHAQVNQTTTTHLSSTKGITHKLSTQQHSHTNKYMIPATPLPDHASYYPFWADHSDGYSTFLNRLCCYLLFWAAGATSFLVECFAVLTNWNVASSASNLYWESSFPVWQSCPSRLKRRSYQLLLFVCLQCTVTQLICILLTKLDELNNWMTSIDDPNLHNSTYMSRSIPKFSNVDDLLCNKLPSTLFGLVAIPLVSPVSNQFMRCFNYLRRHWPLQQCCWRPLWTHKGLCRGRGIKSVEFALQFPAPAFVDQIV